MVPRWDGGALGPAASGPGWCRAESRSGGFATVGAARGRAARAPHAAPTVAARAVKGFGSDTTRILQLPVSP
ncbi:MAG: hypothetical protein ACYTFT_01275, partial [Planctomycetota bacterium]